MKTKKSRLHAILEVYRGHFPGPFTIEAVSEWALANDLWPTPTRSCTAAEAAEWEAKLERAKQTQGGQA